MNGRISSKTLQDDFYNYKKYKRWAEVCFPHAGPWTREMIHLVSYRVDQPRPPQRFPPRYLGPHDLPFYVSDKGEIKSWYRPLPNDKVAVSTTLPGFLDALAEHKNSYKICSCLHTYSHEGPCEPGPPERRKDIIMMSLGAMLIHSTIRAAAAKLADGYDIYQFEIGAWIRFRTRYEATVVLDKLVIGRDEKEARLYLANLAGVPFKSMIFRDDLRWVETSRLHFYTADIYHGYIAIPGAKAILADAYSKINDMHAYDIDLQDHLVDLVDETYEYAISNFNHDKLKVDYQFLVLSQSKTFSRISTTPDLVGVPRYWFDHYDLEADLEAKMDLLAIEKSWSGDGPRYQIEARFPAGTMFLVATVERQATTRGGGIEYILIPTPDLKIVMEGVLPL